MRLSLVRIAAVFLALTVLFGAILLLQVWDVLSLSPATSAKIWTTYGVLSAVLGVMAVVSKVTDEEPKNKAGDRLVD